jgi:hypothetical protein
MHALVTTPACMCCGYMHVRMVRMDSSMHAGGDKDKDLDGWMDRVMIRPRPRAG